MRLGVRGLALALGALAALAAIALPGGAQASPDTHPYSGKTAQKFHLSVATGKGTITLLRFKIRLRCRDGSLLFDDLSDFEPARLRGGGRFSDLQAGGSDEVIFRGRLAKDKVSGILRVRDKLKSGVPCDSGSVGFAVRRVGR
jgi:hypothetical protein